MSGSSESIPHCAQKEARFHLLYHQYEKLPMQSNQIPIVTAAAT